jgi:hypothetical protein
MNKDELKAIYFSFFDQLKPEHAEKAKANYDEDWVETEEPGDHADAIIDGFLWDNSPEENPYWSPIYKDLRAESYPLQLTPQKITVEVKEFTAPELTEESCKEAARKTMYGLPERMATDEDYDKLDKLTAIFPEDDEERQKYAVGTFICEFFPHAIAELARFSYDMQQKHNPGAPMGWAKEKSVGDGNQIFRHQMDGEFREVAWRGLEQLERFLTKMEPFNDK